MCENSDSDAGAHRPPRPPAREVPPTRGERERLARAVERYVAAAALTPPLAFDELRAHTEQAMAAGGIDRRYMKFAAVLVSNEVWRDTLAGIPYARRLLLLPQCLRAEGVCPGEVDEFGLACRHCGRCPIDALQTEAESLGYAVLVSEGTAVVTGLIASGKVDAVVGASCLSVLERVFPYMEAGAVPGVAVPLLNDGCANTSIDLDWLWEAIYLNRADQTRRLDLDDLRRRVHSWFAPESLARRLGPGGGETEQIARGWLARSGKRWRPFLTVCAYQALQDDPAAAVPAAVRDVALAVECFHKASLIHDDIEDGDAARYGRKTLHEEHGVAVALNVGDLLLGEGYRLIASSGAPGEAAGEMLRVAAEGHRRLCLGQGAELCWRRRPRPLASAEVIEIFDAKTAPAFEVALQLAAVCAGAPPAERDALASYSQGLGIAYQIRDDIEDLLCAECGDAAAARPSLLLAVAWERAGGSDRELLEAVWRGSAPLPEARAKLAATLARLKAEAAARELLRRYKDQAIRALRPIGNANLKGLLRRVTGRIFNDLEPTGLGGEHQDRNAPGRGAGAGSAA